MVSVSREHEILTYAQAGAITKPPCPALKNIPKSDRLIALLTILLVRVLSIWHTVPQPIDPGVIPPQRHDSAQPSAHERQFESVS